MSAPEHIYARPDPDGGWRWPRASKFPEQGPHLNVCYLRADIPPPLSAALAVPEVAALVEALRVARRTIVEGGGGGVTCVVWVPNDVCPSETLVDHIDAALAACDAKTPAND